MADFKVFGDAVRKRFKEMSQDKLFTVGFDPSDNMVETTDGILYGGLFAKYLLSFPAGTDPVFRKRTEHDCSCCRNFIKNVGHVVTIQNGAISTVWDLNGLSEPYQAVADAMAAYVRSLPITDVFLTKFGKFGAEITHELESAETGKANVFMTWHHFSCEVPKNCVTKDFAKKKGEARTAHQVLLRGVNELKPEALDTIIELTKAKNLYRGEEFLKNVSEFRQLQAKLLAMPEGTRSTMAWTLIDSPAFRFRNTAIGTLAIDLSEGMDLEQAVRRYEAVMAPANYKRPTALITKSMVEDAMKKIDELGLESALHRRHARLEDVSVNSVLFVDNSVKGKLKGGISDLLMKEVKSPPNKKLVEHAKEISVEDFVKTVIPKISELQLYLDNPLTNNFVSLTAPAEANTGQLLKWNNDFAWSYDGNVADSIKEKVKQAGGKVEGVLMRVSLAWHNFDDLDLHIREPDGNEIAFHRKISPTGGQLDVDMNAGSGRTREPVENIRWAKKLPDGEYTVWVNQYNRRESTNVGFEIEIEVDGQLFQLNCPQSPTNGKNQYVSVIGIKNGALTDIATDKGMHGGPVSQEKWGLKTLELHKVNSMVLSPNYWDDNAVGNKHWFFILDGCKNPVPTRGFYNEFLNPKLEPHRKVFEILGDKMKVPAVSEQMSGIGFSSTRKDKVTVMAMGPDFQQPYTIVF